MRVKLYNYKFIQNFLHSYLLQTVNVWDLSLFVYKKSKHKEQVKNIIKYKTSIGFQRKPVNSKKGPDQQTIYSPFEEFYDVETNTNDV